MLVEAHKKNLTKQHSELFYLTFNGQFKSKMDLPLEKVSKITSSSLTKTLIIVDCNILYHVIYKAFIEGQKVTYVHVRLSIIYII